MILETFLIFIIPAHCSVILRMKYWNFYARRQDFIKGFYWNILIEMKGCVQCEMEMDEWKISIHNLPHQLCMGFLLLHQQQQCRKRNPLDKLLGIRCWRTWSRHLSTWWGKFLRFWDTFQGHNQAIRFLDTMVLREQQQQAMRGWKV